MEELEPWEIEAPLADGSYVWEERSYDLVHGWSEWRPLRVFLVSDNHFTEMGPDSEWPGGVWADHRHKIMLWRLAQSAKNRSGRPADQKDIHDLMEEAFVDSDYRLLRVTDDEADQAAEILLKQAEEDAPRVGDWFVLVAEDPTVEMEFTEGAYGKIVDIQDDWRIIFRVLGVKQKPELSLPGYEEVFVVNPETGMSDRSKPIRKLGQIKLGGVYSYWTDDPETMFFGTREMHKESIPALKRRSGDWKHLEEGLGRK